MNLEFIEPIEDGGGCNMDWCTKRPVSRLRVSNIEFRLCADDLNKFRQVTIDEYRQRVSIPGAPQRRKDGGITIDEVVCNECRDQCKPVCHHLEAKS